MKTLMFMKLDRLRCGGRKSVVVGGALLSLITSGTVAKEERVAGPLPYADEPAVIQAIGGLADRTALALPKFKVDAKSDIDAWVHDADGLCSRAADGALSWG
jgi:hypothetical protein